MTLAPPEPDITPDEITVPDHPPEVCYVARYYPDDNLCPSDGFATWRVYTKCGCGWHFLCTPCKERWSSYGNVAQAVRLP